MMLIFSSIFQDRSGSVSVREFLSVPELKENPLVKRVVDVFDDDLSGEVDFKEFVLGLAHFAVVQEQEIDRKLRFAFRIYDIDRDGYISNGELFEVLKMMVGKNLNDNQLQQIVDKTILYLVIILQIVIILKLFNILIFLTSIFFNVNYFDPR